MGLRSGHRLVLLCLALGKNCSHGLVGVVELTSTNTTVGSGLTLLVGFFALSMITVTPVATIFVTAPTNNLTGVILFLLHFV